MPESSPQNSDVSVLAMSVQLTAAGVDDDELDRMTRQLRSELEEVGVQSAVLAPGIAPAGAKVFDPITLGVLALKLGPTLIPAVTGVLQGWIGRDAGRTVKVSIKVADRSVDLEFSPHQMSAADVNGLVASLTGSLEGKTT
jgi:hypothetical protein